VAETYNLFENVPDKCPTEIFETLFEGKDFKAERIISEGQACPPGEWYDQDWDEWVVLLQGSAAVLFEEDRDPVTLKPGDYLSIPAHKKHRVEWTDPQQKTIWLAIHAKTGESLELKGRDTG
jgi:cupin 2 domain-containing protein